MKTEKADHTGNCYICGGTIYVNDVIVRWEAQAPRDGQDPTPVAAHADCHPDFQVGAASAD